MKNAIRYLLTITNATKAQVLAFCNALLGVLNVLGVGLTEAQTGAIMLVVNAAFGLFVGATFTYSSMRAAHPRPKNRVNL